MDLKEAYEKSGPDDKLSRQGKAEMIMPAKSNAIVHLHDAAQNDWEIIPAKKEPFKRPIDWFESLHGKHELERMHDSGTVMMAFSAGEKNNALLYADLVEAVQNYIDSFNSDIENKYEIMKQALAALPKSS